MIGKLTGEGDVEVKKSIDIYNYKQRLLSIDMKTKVVQHVPRIKFSSFQVLSDFQTFFTILSIY